MDSRLRIGNAIGKSEEEIAPDLMEQVKMHAPDEGPPALSSDGKGAYREAMLKTWGKVPDYGGGGGPPKKPKTRKKWERLPEIKKKEGKEKKKGRIKNFYGEQEKEKKKIGGHKNLYERNKYK